MIRTTVLMGVGLGLLLTMGAAAAHAQTCDDRDADRDGYSCTRGDCDDNNPNTYPGAAELCDGQDNDCNGTIDDAPDNDNDGFNACTDCDDSHAQTYPGAPELCDGRDNDCNPSTVDTILRRDCYTGPAGTLGVGECRGGRQRCDGTRWEATCPNQRLPAPEQCDALDHDCDGNPRNLPDVDGDGVDACTDCDDNDPQRFPGNQEVCDGVDNDCDAATLDAALSRSCYEGPTRTRNVGICRGGNEACTGTAWSGVCAGQVLPDPAESCLPEDRDCDGNLYNGLADADGDGATVCTDCADSDADRFPGNPEVCDGVDNDCDAATLDTNLSRACFPSPTGQPNVGICRAGSEQCTGSRWGACQGFVGPEAQEQCDDLDRDCDGNPFNGFNADNDPVPICRGDCDDQDATVYPGAPELCDGKDNDCDGRRDEEFADVDGDGVAACLDCNDNDASVYPAVPPDAAAPELCDGQDNDCDGDIDEGFTDADGDGYVNCGPNRDCRDDDPLIHPGRSESCDGIDNDCDTLIDERGNGQPLRRSCYTGPAETAGVGMCESGRWECTNGRWPTDAAACVGQILPSAETCDQEDDDCDGEVDEDFDQDRDGFTTCAPNVDCNDGDDQIHPGRSETCDGKDNDCDNATDERRDGEPLRIACYTGPSGTQDVGLCRGGHQLCQGASGFGGACVDEVVPATDVCDGEDNNCDGEVDETFDRDGDGVTDCGGDCNDDDPSIHPGALEVCNAIDDNCDGTVDGQQTECYTGPAGTATVGACHPGVAICRDGQPADCRDEQRPVPETCDQIDNDCDGLIDEDFDADQDGVISCSGDCDDNNPFVATGLPERCDCQDNDCDNAIDEDGFGGSICEQGACHDFDGDGYTNCDGDCDDRWPSSYPGAPEICGDNIDNDCDGVVDENVDEDGDGVTTCDGDCDDRFAAIRPDAAEVCDGFDNDCDNEIDEDFDQDGDGATVCAGDCDDNDRLRSPLTYEVCGNNVDDDCDGIVDPDDDIDGDGYSVCDGDCNDFNAAVYPGAEEVCDAHDNDCDLQIDEGFNQDGDAFAVCFGDCADNDPNIHPFAPEIVDGVDNNCDGRIDEGQEDADGDGFSFLCGDCNDANPAIGPQSIDICDGVDNDCDGRIDRTPLGQTSCATCNDADGDGVSDCDGDCQDNDPTIHPGITETCNGRDDDCDGTTDRDRLTGANLCVANDAGMPAPSDASAPSGDGSAPDAGPGGGPNADAGTPAALPPADNGFTFGCSAARTASDRPAPAWAFALLLGAILLRLRVRESRPPGFARAARMLAVLAAIVGCTSFEVVPAPVGSQGPDASVFAPEVGQDGGFVDAGRLDAGPTDYAAGPCRIVGPGNVALHKIPSGGFQMAAHSGTDVTPLPNVDALALTDFARGLYAFVLRAPLDADLAPDDPLAASRWLDRHIDPLFARELPGVIGVADRVDERLKQAFLRRGRPAARTLRTVTMVNDVAPSHVRRGALARLASSALAEINVPLPPSPSPTRVLALAAYAETETDHVRVVVAVADNDRAEAVSTRLADLATGSHIGPAGLPVQVECEPATAEALRVDFMWVVDNSQSMLEEQEALSAAAVQFFDALSRSGIDYRLGVVSTDGEALRGESFTRDVDAFRRRVRVGVNGNGDEQGLEFAVRAVERASRTSSSAARLRDDAVSVVIFFSDEDSTNLLTPDAYAEALARRGVLAFAVVGPRPRGCTAIGRGVARRGESYIQVVERLGGTSASICAEDLGQPIDEILLAAGGAASRIGLEELPIAGSIEVAVSDRLIDRSRLDGFDYEPTANTVLFFGRGSPPVGTDFRISYVTFTDADR